MSLDWFGGSWEKQWHNWNYSDWPAHASKSKLELMNKSDMSRAAKTQVHARKVIKWKSPCSKLWKGNFFPRRMYAQHCWLFYHTSAFMSNGLWNSPWKMFSVKFFKAAYVKKLGHLVTSKNSCTALFLYEETCVQRCCEILERFSPLVCCSKNEPGSGELLPARGCVVLSPLLSNSL